ncbi:MAG TPA: hypothetical protein VNK23_11230 [Candidatus Dormibacteraeota bacterium]|nr:hypothetical protein [Candidatus Dormibacteraeota bacterium]
MKTFKPTAIVALFLLAALPASAQMFGRPQIPSGIVNPLVGGGAVYEFDQGNGRKSTVEIAMIGKESVDGKDGYWIEMTVSDTPMGQMIAKVLYVIAEGRATTSKMIMQMGSRPPMEMPSQMQSSNGVNFADIRNKADDLGMESVTTPAGTFSCHHYRAKDGSGDSWVSESVHPIGLVKSVDKDSTTTVLVKTLTGVKDKITGTPVPFNPMMMMPQSKQ